MGETAVISPTDRFDKCEGHEISLAPDGYIIHQVAKARVHFLNELAATVFELCDGTNEVKTIEAFVAKAFERAAPPADAVSNCLSMLLTEDLILPCTPSSSGR